MAASKSKSVLLGFSVCPLCGGKTHVKRIDAEGKKAYSHCLDEHDQGCSHTHYATNAQQDRLMREKMRPVGGASPTPRQEPEAAPAPAATVEPPPSASPPRQAPARRGLFGSLIGGGNG